MIRLLNAHFPSRTIFLGLSEACLVSCAFLLATFVRLGGDEAAIMLAYDQGVLKIAVVLIASIACMYYFDLYSSSLLTNRREAVARMIQVMGSECILLAAVYYVYPPLELGRGIFLIGFAFMAVFLFLWRALFARFNVLPRFAQRTLLFGDGPLAEPLLYEFGTRPELGINVVSHLLATVDFDSDRCDSETSSSHSPEGLSHLVTSCRVSRVVVAMGERRGRMPVGTLLSLKSRGVVVQDGTDVYEAITGKIPIESLRLGWLLFSPGFHVSRFLLLYKRVAALIVSAVGLLLSLPLLPFIILSVKGTSPGPVLYRQKRVGRNRVVFDCYKFRTMRADAEADSGPTWAGDDDPRITPIGKFLRKSRMDEIPQFWNVLKGDMDFVGPRPERPEFVGWLNREIPHYNLRHTIRPGLTGWAQIRYQYGSSVSDAKEKLQYDLFYIKNMSPGLDLLIFLQTIKIILLGRGAR